MDDKQKEMIAVLREFNDSLQRIANIIEGVVPALEALRIWFDLPEVRDAIRAAEIQEDLERDS